MKATEASPVADTFLEEALSDPESGFSIGVSGAIAEFMRNDGEADWQRDGSVVTVTTREGAMRVALNPRVVPVAAELPSRRPEHWQQQVAFCLDENRAAMGARQALTELGADADAIDPSRRQHLLFDLGLGLAHVDACIRTDDTGLIALLRRAEGRALFTQAKQASDAIVAASPERVFCSTFGRIEVYAPIPERKTPEGPHTHLLPALLGRPSPIAGFVSPGLVSCLDVYPANPLRSVSGKARAFDRERHARFQKVLEAWGPPEYVAEKRRVAEWMHQGKLPEECPAASGVLAGIGRRVALRQLSHDGADQGTLDAWRQSLDRG